jgi:hypothetical protein
MTAKEKANELVGKCFDTFINDEEEHYVEIAWRLSKQCALIAVDEIIEAIDFDWMEVQNLDSEHRYWEKVRQEIEKL